MTAGAVGPDPAWRRALRQAPLLAAAAGLLAFVVPALSLLVADVGAQSGVFKEERFAGLQWTFVRVKYTPTQHLRSPYPDSGYFADGGVSTRPADRTTYAVWSAARDNVVPR